MKLQILRFTLCLLMCLTFPPLVTAQVVDIPEPVPPPFAVREAFELDPFYQQWIDVEGFPVLASEKVSPYAVKEAAWLIRQMIGHRPAVLRAMAHNNVRFVIMAHDEMTTDIPEHSDLRPDFYWDRRVRGLGATRERPAVSCGEENLLNYPGDPYWNENILIHEFSHALHQMGLNTVNPDFDNQLKSTFETAKKNKLWKGTYASTNKEEYWAEGVQSWFNTNRENDAEHNNVNTRTELKNYDTALATLLGEVFGDTDWRYVPATTRTHLPHLQGFNLQGFPTFEWPPELAELDQQLRNPDSDGSGKWVNLNRYRPSELSRLKSSSEGVSTEIIFVNNSIAEFSFYWVNSDGKETYHGRVPIKGYSIQYTYAGHIWLVKDSNGRSLAVFQAVEKTGRALINEVPILITPGLSKVSGDNQTSVSGTVLAKPLIIEVRDENGSVLAGISVIFAVTGGGGTLSTTTTQTDENGRAQSTLTLGPNLGTNTVEVSATGIEGTVTFHAISDTESPPITADVNSDGSVNILDLILIASDLGNAGTNLAVDVNRDGVVSILDLILAAGMFEGTAAAPAAHAQAPKTLTAVEVQGWLIDARALQVRDPIMKRGFVVLEQLLVSLTPTETELLANYPNPFNPETWIPYRLAEDAFVTLTIYDGNGRVIRTLDVGHRIASAYENRSKAVYWDGRNGAGERVASGVYIYHLSAGEYSATRRMVILK